MSEPLIVLAVPGVVALITSLGWLSDRFPGCPGQRQERVRWRIELWRPGGA